MAYTTLDFDVLAETVDADTDLRAALSRLKAFGPVYRIDTEWATFADEWTLFVCSSASQKPMLAAMGFPAGIIFSEHEFLELLATVGDHFLSLEDAMLYVAEAPQEGD